MLRIAVCDDDLKFTGDFETLVLQESRNMGIRVETDVFSDGDTLVKSILSGERYNLIFLDIEMKQVDGISAARCIREIDRSVLLIYISGYDQYLKELFEVEPFRFLSKPVNDNKFCRYFREACQRMQIPLHRITDSASNGSVFPVVTEHFSASSDHAFL